MKVKDDIEKYYSISATFAKSANICYWLNVIIAAATLVIPNDKTHPCFVAQVLLALAYVILTITDDCSFWYKAETGRLRDNIANAFAVNLVEERTEGYYSNNEAPSVKRYAVNAYESAFYSREESKAMLPKKLPKRFYL